MEFVHVFVLTSLALDKKGDVKSRNVAVTFDLFEAEDHRNKGIEHDYDVFVVPCDWRETQRSPSRFLQCESSETY